MASITDFGGGRDILRHSLGISNELTVVSASATEVVVRNVETQFLTILTGTDLAPVTTVSGGLRWVTGTLTGFEMQGWDGSANQPGLVATGLSWDAAFFFTSVRHYVIERGEGGIAVLLSQQPVTWDAGDAVTGTHAGFWFVTSEMTLTGSAFGDTLNGGLGNDTILGGDGDDRIQTGGNAGGDLIDTGAGSDIVDFEAFFPIDRTSHYTLSHRALADQTGIVATLSDSDRTPSVIDKGSFGRTQLVNMGDAITWGRGLTVEGTGLDDRFDITIEGRLFPTSGFIGLTPGRGNDTVRAEGPGHVGLNFATDSNGIAATEGAQVNLATGAVANDGFGFADVLVLRGGIDVSVTLTAEADRLVVTNRSGTLRGGDGIDTLDFGQGSFTEGVEVDLETSVVRGGGPADGSVHGEGFRHVIDSFENLIGTRDHGDALWGTDGANRIKGLGGNDTILGDGFRAAYAPERAAQVYRLYQAAFDREPDAVGLHGWTERLAEGGLTLLQVAQGFAGGPEFRSLYGALDDAAFVTALYQNALDRDPDAGGLGAWVARLQAGASRAEVLRGFSESREFGAKTPVEARGFAEANWSDDVFRLYQATLDRAPDQTGFLDWLGRLGGGTRFLSAVESFTASTEFQATYGALDNRAFVTALYHNVLDRAPHSWEVSFSGWLTRPRAEAVLGFLQSREFQQDTAKAAKDFVQGFGGGDTLDGGAGDNQIWGGDVGRCLRLRRGHGRQYPGDGFRDLGQADLPRLRL